LRLLYEPVQLVERYYDGSLRPYAAGQQFTDGSVESDLPMQRLSELFNINHFIVSQVNPHAIPFLQDLRYSGRTTESWVDSIVRKAKLLLSSEFKHRLRQAMDVGLVPRSNALLQDSTGDITIVPHFKWLDYTRLVSNPTEDFRAHCTQEGERSTWPTISVIKTRCQIERCLEECVQSLRDRTANSLPSYHQAAIAQSHIQSSKPHAIPANHARFDR